MLEIPFLGGQGVQRGSQCTGANGSLASSACSVGQVISYPDLDPSDTVEVTFWKTSTTAKSTTGDSQFRCFFWCTTDDLPPASPSPPFPPASFVRVGVPHRCASTYVTGGVSHNLQNSADGEAPKFSKTGLSRVGNMKLSDLTLPTLRYFKMFPQYTVRCILRGVEGF